MASSRSRTECSHSTSARIAPAEKSSSPRVVLVKAVAGGNRRMPPRKPIEVVVDDRRDRARLSGRRRAWPHESSSTAIDAAPIARINMNISAVILACTETRRQGAAD